MEGLKSDSFKKTLIDYESLESKIQKLENSLKDLRKERNKLEDTIIDIMISKNLKGKTLNLGTSKLTFEEKTTTSGLSQSLVKSSLDKYFLEQYAGKYGDDKALAKSKEVFDFILNSRTDKITPSIKLSFTSPSK